MIQLEMRVAEEFHRTYKLLVIEFTCGSQEQRGCTEMGFSIAGIMGGYSSFSEQELILKAKFIVLAHICYSVTCVANKNVSMIEEFEELKR